MKLLLVHLSDIHVRGDDDAILGRAGSIAAAVRNLDYELDAAVVAVSGDLAYAGGEGQYEAVWRFLCAISSQLSVGLRAGEGGTPVPVHVVAIPGNHDCDFSQPGGARSMVIGGVLAEPRQVEDRSVVDVCVKVQEPFFAALEEHGTDGVGTAATDYDRRLSYEYRIAVGGETVRLLCLNTAWLSQMHEEQGKLYLPADAVPVDRDDAAVVVAMLHHPYNWIESNAARALRKRIETVADLILTGHEHDASARAQQVSTGERNLYVEAGALQDSAIPGDSTFSAFVLDLAVRKQKTAQFVWEGDLYALRGAANEAGDGFGLLWEEFQVSRLHGRDAFELAPSMRELLDDPGVNLAHRNRAAIRLSDVFVFPDMEESIPASTEARRVVHGDTVIELVADAPRLLIIGDTQGGKTCLAKVIYRYLHQGGYVPVLVDGATRLPSGERLHARLVDLFAQQYHPAMRDAFRQLDHSRRVIIVDDFHKLPLNPRVRQAFIDALTAFASKVILLADDVASEAADLLYPRGRVTAAAAFVAYRILPFGYERRDALVDKWLLLDGGGEDGAAEIAHRRDGITRTLNALIGRNLLPPYPVYVLAVLQGAEATTPLDTRMSTYGSYYEIFIRAALARGRTPVQSDIVLNYLAHFAYHLFVGRVLAVDDEAFEDVHRSFERRYEISLSAKNLRDELVACDMLAVSGGVRFKYPYAYYYFVASWLRDHINEPVVRAQIADLSRSVHIEKHANILLFLAHLSKDPVVVQEMRAAAQLFYVGMAPAAFGDDMAPILAMGATDAQLTYEERDIDEERKRRLARLDEYERASRNVAGGEGEAGDGPTLDDSTLADGSETAADTLNPIITLVAALKTLEILGQVLKSFPGSLEGDVKHDIARECYGLGLRAATWFFGELQTHEADIVREMIDAVRQGEPHLRDEQAERRARKVIMGLLDALGFVVIRSIASAVGSPELGQTYRRVAAQDDMPSVHLVNTSIRLDQSAAFPEGLIQTMARDLERQPFARRMLSYLVLNHFISFPVRIESKRRACAALGIQYTPLLGRSSRRSMLTE